MGRARRKGPVGRTGWAGEAGRPGQVGRAGRPGRPRSRSAGSWRTGPPPSRFGSSWPVLAVWWDGDRAGHVLAPGFRRPVGHVWLADGTPAGEDEAMRTFAERPGPGPVLAVQVLDGPPRSDPDADARSRLLGVLVRIGPALPSGPEPGASTDRLRAVADGLPGAEPVVGDAGRERARAGLDAVGSGVLGPWVRGPGARVPGGAQSVAGLPLVLRGAGRRGGGRVFAGGLLMAHGALGLACDRLGRGRRVGSMAPGARTIPGARSARSPVHRPAVAVRRPAGRGGRLRVPVARLRRPSPATRRRPRRRDGPARWRGARPAPRSRG